MELHFCSLCNQSIPMQDIESRESVVLNGKRYCSTCRYIDLPSRKKAPSYLALYLGFCLICSLAAVGYLLFRDDLFPPEPTVQARTLTDKEILMASLQDLQRKLIEVTRHAEQRVGDEFTRFDLRLVKQERALAEVVRRIEALGKNKKPVLSKEDTDKLKGNIQGILYEVEFIRDDLSKLKGAVQGMRGEQKPAAPPQPAEEVKVAEEETEPEPTLSEVERWIAQTKNKDPVNRLIALKELRRFRGSNVTRALVRCLKDWNPSVRRAAAEDLGNRKEEASAPALVELLKDQDATVRETTVQSLRKITGRRFGFRSDSSERRRAAAAGRWQTFIVGLMKKSG